MVKHYMQGIWDKVLKTKYKYLYKNSFYKVLYFTIESDIDKVFFETGTVSGRIKDEAKPFGRVKQAKITQGKINPVLWNH